jgi:arginine transport system substrate-binding protein
VKFKVLLLVLSCFISSSVLAQTIKFGTEATYPPFESMSPAGQIQGFDIDMANAICAELKAKCVFANQPFDGLIPSLSIGKFDALIAALNITDARAKVVDFTIPYYASTASFVAAKNVNFDTTPGKMKNKIIGVQQGTTLQTYLKKIYGKDVTVKTYASEESAFLDLAAGRLDAVMGDTPLVINWLHQHGKNQFHIVGAAVNDPAYFGSGYGIAVKKGNTVLLNQLNSAIRVLEKNGTTKKIANHYFSE